MKIFEGHNQKGLGAVWSISKLLTIYYKFVLDT